MQGLCFLGKHFITRAMLVPTSNFTHFHSDTL
jgi:hypothetical protein